MYTFGTNFIFFYIKKHAYDIVHENWRERVKGDALKIQSLSQDNQEILSTLQSIYLLIYLLRQNNGFYLDCFQDSVALPLKDLANKFKNHFGGRWDFSCLGLGALEYFYSFFFFFFHSIFFYFFLFLKPPSFLFFLQRVS